MIKNKNNGFTLVELLAVIAILGLILIIAVPKVTDTINNSKRRTLELTAESIIKKAEEKNIENDTFDIDEAITCESIASISEKDYKSCKIKINDLGEATVTIVGSGRYEGLSICNGTKFNVSVVEGECPLVCEANEVLLERGVADKPYVIKNYDNCANYITLLMTNMNMSEETIEEAVPSLCSGNGFDGGYNK